MRRRMRKCRVCGKPFQPKPRGKIALYCSRPHRQRAYEKRRLARLASNHVPWKLLLSDVKQPQSKRQQTKELIIEILKEISPALGKALNPPKPKKPLLHLVKGGKVSVETGKDPTPE